MCYIIFFYIYIYIYISARTYTCHCDLMDISIIYTMQSYDLPRVERERESALCSRTIHIALLQLWSINISLSRTIVQSISLSPDIQNPPHAVLGSRTFSFSLSFSLSLSSFSFFSFCLSCNAIRERKIKQQTYAATPPPMWPPLFALLSERRGIEEGW